MATPSRRKEELDGLDAGLPARRGVLSGKHLRNGPRCRRSHHPAVVCGRRWSLSPRTLPLPSSPHPEELTQSTWTQTWRKFEMPAAVYIQAGISQSRPSIVGSMEKSTLPDLPKRKLENGEHNQAGARQAIRIMLGHRFVQATPFEISEETFGAGLCFVAISVFAKRPMGQSLCGLDIGLHLVLAGRRGPQSGSRRLTKCAVRCRTRAHERTADQRPWKRSTRGCAAVTRSSSRIPSST